uniref:Col_cuticle_N domain-containing protein n=1 Tax=Heterorhabditis bacteriophora TaxID=37862 RepID=A0A1I7XM50_HETBA
MESDGRTKAYKFVAYAAVSFSIVAVLSVVLTLPMVYNYVSHVRRQMQHEISFCKHLEHLVYQESHPLLQLLLLANHVHKDHQDHQDLPELPEIQERQELQDAQELMLHLDSLDHEDLQDQPESQIPEHPLKANPLHPEHLESLEMLVSRKYTFFIILFYQKKQAILYNYLH